MSDWPLARKLTAMLVLLTGFVLLLTVLASTGYEYWAFRRAAREGLLVTARIVASNSTSSLAFSDDADAREILSALRADSDISAAALYDVDGRLFAAYPDGSAASALPAAPGPDGYRFERGRLVGFQAVSQPGGARLGTLYVASDLGALSASVRLSAIIGATVFVLSLIAAYGLSGILHRSISRPILSLAETATAISRSNDLSVRAPDVGGGELGELAYATNRMLDTIEEQRRALIASKEEIEGHADVLERRVAERTQELEETNDVLRRNAASLEVANKELDAFAYSVSHDLRAPLRSIDGFSHVLLEDYGRVLDETAHGYLARVRAASQKMGALIDDMLKLSRITRAEMNPETVDLSEMATEIAEDLKGTAPDRRVVFDIAPGLEAQGDRRLLHVVMQNLLGNSWKYSVGRPEARIELATVQVNGEHAFMVRDNGAGFDMKYADKLFGEFQRLHADAEFEGTGVGLATVRRIVVRHGGRIWAEGVVDEGATFYFTL